MKISSLIWLLKKPAYLQQWVEILKRRLIYQNDEFGKEDSIKWCEENAVSEIEALAKLTGESQSVFLLLRELLEEEYSSALSSRINAQRKWGEQGHWIYYIIWFYIANLKI